MGDGVTIRYRSLALEQVNSKEGEDWKAWNQGEDYVSRGLWLLRGGIAARRQGETAHLSYMTVVLEAKHVDREDIRSRDSVVEVASRAELDIEQFTKDIDDPATLREIGEDHESAVELGVFGTPTFVFENGTAAFLKTFTPPEEDTLPAFEHLMGMAGTNKYFGELKRPQPPWPRGYDD